MTATLIKGPATVDAVVADEVVIHVQIDPVRTVITVAVVGGRPLIAPWRSMRSGVAAQLRVAHTDSTRNTTLADESGIAALTRGRITLADVVARVWIETG